MVALILMASAQADQLGLSWSNSLGEAGHSVAEWGNSQSLVLPYEEHSLRLSLTLEEVEPERSTRVSYALLTEHRSRPLITGELYIRPNQSTELALDLKAPRGELRAISPRMQWALSLTWGQEWSAEPAAVTAERLRYVLLWPDAKVSDRIQGPWETSRETAPENRVAGLTPFRLVKAYPNGIYEVKAVTAEERSGHCHFALSPLNTWARSVFVREEDLAPVVASIWERSWPDGSAVRLSPGVALTGETIAVDGLQLSLSPESVPAARIYQPREQLLSSEDRPPLPPSEGVLGWIGGLSLEGEVREGWTVEAQQGLWPRQLTVRTGCAEWTYLDQAEGSP